jgi:hypothetical protein
MFGITCVPTTVYDFLARFKHHFACAQGKHFLLCCWIVTGLILDTGTGCLTSVMRYLPARISYFAALRMLRVGQWQWAALITQASRKTLTEVPAPADGTLYLAVDPSLKQKRGSQCPLARKTRLNRLSPYVFGFEFVLVVACFGPYRVPVFIDVVDPAIRGHANHLIRQAIKEFVAPEWARRVIVLGDAGICATQTLRRIQGRGFDYVFATPRSRRFADGRSLRDLVLHLPKSRYRRRASHKPDGRRRDYWMYLKRAELNNLGDVTILLSKKRRNDGPKNVKIIVTNRTDLDAGEICSIYAWRWCVELTLKELKGGLHLGRMQVTKDPERVRRAVALPVLAYITLVWTYGRAPTTQRSFSIFELKRRFTEDILRQHAETRESRSKRRLTKAKLAA